MSTRKDTDLFNKVMRDSASVRRIRVVACGSIRLSSSQADPGVVGAPKLCTQSQGEAFLAPELLAPAAASDAIWDASVWTASVSPAAIVLAGVGGESSWPAWLVCASTRP